MQRYHVWIWSKPKQEVLFDDDEVFAWSEREAVIDALNHCNSPDLSEISIRVFID